MKPRFSLRQTTLLVIASVVLGLTGVLLFTVRSTLQNELQKQETDEVTVNVERAAALIQSSAAGLETTAQALMRASYPASPAALAEEFTAERMNSLGLEAVAFASIDKGIIFERGFDLQTHTETSVPPELANLYSHPTITMILAKGAQTGLWASPNGPFFVTVVPWAAAGEPTPLGVLVAARRFSATDLEAASRLLHVDLRLAPASEGAGNGGVTVLALSDSSVQGSTLLTDLSGRPVYELQVEQPRTVFLNGQRTLNFLLVAQLSTSISFGVMVFLLIELLVLSRLSRLSREVEQIARSGDPTRRVTLSRSDELTRLCEGINQMLAALEQAQTTLQASQARFRSLVESMDDIVLTIDRDQNVEETFGGASRLRAAPGDLSTFFNRPDPIHRESFLRALQGEVVGYEWSAVVDHELRTFHTSLSPVRGSGGEVLRVVSVGRDITQLKALETNLRQRLEETNELYEISRSFLSQLDPQAVLDLACQAAVERFWVDYAVSGLPVRGGEMLDPAAVCGSGPAAVDLPELSLVEGALAQAVRQGQIAVFQRPEDLPGFAQAAGLASMLAIPIYQEGELQAVLGLFSKSDRFFTPERIPLLSAFVNLAGLALRNARLYADLRSGRADMARLSQRLAEVQEEERHRLALELHDEIGQALTGLKLLLETGLSGDPARAAKPMQSALATVNELIGRVRQMSLDLRPSILDDLGLLPALVWHFGRYSEQTGIQVQFQHSGLEGRRFASNVEVAAFRVIQEALTNAARHAGVRAVSVQIRAAEGWLSLQVEDEGAGFDPTAVWANGNTRGLLGMRERVTGLGGQLTVDSSPGRGTCLTVELPIEEREK